MNRIPGFRLDGISADFSYLAKDRQTISVTDLVSEGPIYGLVDGAASVYLNDDRAVPLSEASSYYSQSAALVAFTNGSTSATISGAGANPIIESEVGTKYLIVRSGHGGKQVTASNGSAGTDNFAITATLTTQNTDSFFTADMVSSPADVDTHVPARLGILATGGIGDGAFGEGWIIKRTSASVAEFVPGSAAGPSGLWVPNGNYFLEVDRIVEISSVSGQTVTLAAAWTGVTGSYKFDVTGAIVAKIDVVTQSQTTNHEGVTTQFRVGTMAQTPFSGRGGNGSTSISNNPSGGGVLERSNNYGGSNAPFVLGGTSAAGFNLTASQAQEVDEARFTIAYPNGHYAVSNGGKDKFTHTQYKVMIAVKKPGESAFESFQVLKNPLTHSSMDKNAVSFVETIDLTMFRPFSDFKVQVERISNHEGDAFEKPGVTYDGWTQITASSLTNTTCVIKDILTHPFSAMANVTFDTKRFQGIPTRSYHLKGLKVSVPSNYVTREQTSDGVATYNRNITSGAITTSYQDWDGAFASEKVYTNNPAWIFYDVLTNNRYGLGDFLKDDDVDKYALYRIARYCDALVDDGKGGKEPRFTSNLYFTKAADAYKVLKDMGTVFRSMLYYIDGKVVPIIDAPSGPVYNFTKANVIDGAFSYEGTGSKTRINQCVVTWIDPEANYKASPLLVEDRLNIAETGTIISQNAMAMGATSEGQALRYGRWKLWTAANQREVVVFSTALNASFLMPGDIINVQDSDRYAVRIGGRVSNSGTDASTTSIPLDSTTSLLANSTYELSVMFVEPGAFSAEDVFNTATPPVKIYSKGDLVKQAFVTGSSSLQNIDTEEKASNARITSGGLPLDLSWSEHTRVEMQPVTAALSGNSVDTITVTTAFSAVPPAESIWVLTETADGLTVLGSAKEYKVLAISQSAKNEFGISAVEHYDEKFAAVDEDFTTYIADSVYPAVRHNDVVPPVTDVYATSMMNPNFTGEELTIQWSPPVNVGELEGIYEHLAGYEIHHDFLSVESPVIIENADQTTFKIEGVEDGTYNIAVKAVNILQNVSSPTVSVVTVSDKYKENIPRLPLGVPYGGTTNVGFYLTSSSFAFQNYEYSVKHPSDKAALITNTNTSTSAWQQSYANLPTISWTESDRKIEGQFIDEHAYILVDASDSTDRLKLVKYHKPFGSNPFWYDMGTGNATNKYGSALTGTFTKGVGTTKVTGSGTAFLSQIKDGDNLKLGSTEGYKVAAVVSDTLLYVTNNFSSFSGVQGFIPNIRIDYANDVIIARVFKTSAGLILGEVYSKLDSVLKKAKNIVEEDGVSVEELDTSSATGGTFGAAVAALDAASFTSIDTAVLDADSVIAREVQVFPSGGTPPTISGTTLAGAGIDLKQDGDMYVGNAATNKYMFWDQSEGTMTFRGTLDVDDIVGSSATFGTLMAEVATIGTLNTEMLDSDAIVTRDIRVGPSVETNAGSFVTGTEYYITVLGNTTQAQWNSVAGTSGVVYNLGSIFTAANAGTGTGKARNRTTVAKIAGATLTGTGAHLNAAGDFYVGNASTNKYMFWDQSAGTMQIRGALNADDITAGNITASNINVANLSSLTANLGAVTAGTIKGDTMPDANAAPSGSEKGAFLDLTAGKMIFGNASKYIWWDGTDLTLSGVTINAAQLTGSTGFATEGFVTTAISNLVGTANANLDTLGEIATALNNDAALNATLTTSIATKLPKAGGQMTGNITFSSTQTVDGRDVSVDGAKLDTIESGATNTVDPYYTGAIAVGDGGLTQKNFTTALKNKLDGVATGANVAYYTGAIAVGDGGLTQKNFTTTLKNKLDGVATGATNTVTNATHTGEVTGSGALIITDNVVDAGNLKVTGNGTTSQFLRSDGDGTFTWATPPNTEYSVGDGGLTQNNFTNADHSKLNGIAVGANVAHYTSAIAVGDGGLTQKNFTTALNSKLVGIADGATNTAVPTYTSPIAVGDGGLTQNNFTNADHSKLDGIATGANVAYYTTAIAVGAGGLTQQNFTTALKNKLDAVANNATNVTNNNQLTNGANYITAGGSAASLGGVAATGYVLKTDNEALHGTDALAFSSGTLTLRKGDNTTETVSLPNTVYSVQDGQLSQNNFTNADHSKLDGIAAGANVAHYTSAIAVGDGGLTQKNFTTTLKNKLDGVATGATNTVTNATHTGEVTGSGALTITDNVVDAGNLKVTGNGTTSQFLRSDGDGTFTWVTPPNTQYSVGDGGLTQKNFTTTLKNKLDGVATGATNTVTNATHTGEVTGSGALTITDNVVDAGNLKVTGNGTTSQFLRSDGDGTFTWVTPPNTEYSVGDGGLTQKNFTTTLKNKLDGVTAGANVAYYTSAIAVGAGGLTQQNFTTVLKNKLDGVAAGANNYAFPYTISQSAGNSTVVRRHDSGYIFANYFNTTPNTVTSGVTQVCVETGNDGYIRHGTAAAIRTFINVADGANNFVHPNDGVDYGAANTGATVISDVAVNALGHVTGFTNRSLTLGNLGFTGATNANYITDNNQIANSRGYITSASDSSKLPLAGGTMTGALNMGGQSITTSGNTNIELDPGGSGVVIFKGNSTKGAGQFKLNCEANTHGITIKGPPHSAGASYTLTLPNNDGNANQVLKTDGSGVTSWADQSSSGVSTVQAGSGVGGIIVSGGTTATATLSVHANLEAIADGDAISGTLRTDILEANTVLATYITADSINANHLAVSNNVADATSQGIYFDANGVITIRDSSGNIRVKIGDLS